MKDFIFIITATITIAPQSTLLHTCVIILKINNIYIVSWFLDFVNSIH